MTAGPLSFRLFETTADRYADQALAWARRLAPHHRLDEFHPVEIDVRHNPDAVRGWTAGCLDCGVGVTVVVRADRIEVVGDAVLTQCCPCSRPR